MTTLNELEQAMSALEQAVRLGYSIDLINADPGLARLRETDAYTQLVEPDKDVLVSKRRKSNE